MKEILVGNYQVKIIRTPLDHILGDFCSNQLLIRIRDDLRGWAYKEVLFHEISHAIYWAYSMRDDDEEERTVSIISTGWTQVLRDNPKLLTKEFLCDTN